MTDYPVIFSAAMVQALLAGRKTMIRRLAWRSETWAPELASERLEDFELRGWDCKRVDDGWQIRQPSPWQKVKPGDRLWVREAITRSGGLIQYMLDHKTSNVVWPAAWKRDTAPGMHMPRQASRLTLIVTATKIERLQDISAADSIAEGVECDTCVAMRASACNRKGCFASQSAFHLLWRSLHGRESWDANPEVVAISFRVIRENIDRVRDAA